MATAQAVLIVGGMANLFYSTLAAYSLYWVRLRSPLVPPPRYGLISHTSAVTNGLLLLGLSIAIAHTGFAPYVNIGLAGAEVVATVASNGRNLLSWHDGHVDGFSEVSPLRRRLRGLGNMLHLVVMSAVLYGVTRSALGI
jgi:hypothetical protein